MKIEKYNVLLKVIDRWEIDVENGIVKTKRGTGTLFSTGYVNVATTYEGKQYNFLAHHIILVKAGLIPIGKVVNHINGIKTDNRFINLELVTHSDNNRHAYKLGLKNYSGGHKFDRTITDDVINKVIQDSKTMSQRKIAEKYGISQSTVGRIRRGEDRYENCKSFS